VTSTSKNKSMFYRILVAIFVWLVCLSVNAQQKEQRVALVIGNSSYKSSPLKNPVNDARDMANSLRGYGFTVIERTNLTTRQVGQTLREFRSKLTPGSVAVVFYAGHGVQIKGENYLPTVDAEINGEEDVPMQSLSTRQVMDILGEAKTRMNLVFLDACRDNPYARSFRSSNRGIAKENAPSGTLISFATRPGSVAADGDGRNGLYTSVLLEQIKQSNQPIEQVLKRVVTGVKSASKGQQEPWMEGSIEGEFCFGTCGIAGAVQAQSSIQINDSKLDEKFWEDAKSIGTKEGYEAYLAQYPAGRFSSLAKAQILRLSPAPITQQPSISNSAEVSVPVGYYRVREGDTLIKIGMNHGQSFRDLATWNNISGTPSVGTLIRVSPPAQSAPTPSTIDTQPDSTIRFQWPSDGDVISNFSEKNKGVDVKGQAGDPILAAADGKVVYAGAGLRGYGNLLIIKHDDTLLTAYAHNQTLLVTVDQLIKKGQKIAEMGSSDADQVKLHFEIRKSGKPVDPMTYLSPR
jgi:murein DD-endopeptidase MepM/ murein hydrolase activator NlpD